jgi:hypothetical protein
MHPPPLLVSLSAATCVASAPIRPHPSPPLSRPACPASVLGRPSATAGPRVGCTCRCRLSTGGRWGWRIHQAWPAACVFLASARLNFRFASTQCVSLSSQSACCANLTASLIAVHPNLDSADQPWELLQGAKAVGDCKTSASRGAGAADSGSGAERGSVHSVDVPSHARRSPAQAKASVGLRRQKGRPAIGPNLQCPCVCHHVAPTLSDTALQGPI